MTAPAAGYIRYPLDTGNLGKKIQCGVETVGADVVYDNAQTVRRQAKILGAYRYAMVQQTLVTGPQNGTTSGYLWMVNPVANTTKNIRVHRMWGSSGHNGTAAGMSTAPRLLASRFTFTGTGSGTALVPDKIASAYPTATALLQAASTGWTPVLGAQMSSAGVLGSMTVLSAANVAPLWLLDAQDEDEYEVLAAGEGVIVWQDTAGNGAEARKFDLNVLWDEIDIS